MQYKKNNNILLTVTILLVVCSCKVPALIAPPNSKTVPTSYTVIQGDSTSSGQILVSNFFKDNYLKALIDTALVNNQELAMTLQEIEIAKNEIKVKHGNILPRVEAGGAIGMDKVGRYTSTGAGDASTDIKPGKPVPEWLPDFRGGAIASWEVDIWKKLRIAKKAAVLRYAATVEGRNFIITNLVGEIANNYYELLALDNQLTIIKQTIQLQENALNVVKIQKQAAAATELAVKKFEAEVASSQSLEYDVRQKIQEKENVLNLLIGRYPTPIKRDTTGIMNITMPLVNAGLPSQLLLNRPDIKQAELSLTASKLDVAVARAEFLPRLNITGALGFQAFNPLYLAKLPESVLFNLANDFAGPIINRHAITAEYNMANAKQIHALYNYDLTVLNSYIEVNKEIGNIKNLEAKYTYKKQEVELLVKSIDIANDLFKYAKADYLEVLMTQRDALESKLELVETKLQQATTITRMYRALGGGWQ